MRAKDVLLVGACCLGIAAIVLFLALVGTPEVSGWAATAGRAALGSTTVGLMMAGAGILFLGSLAAQAWAIAREAARERRGRAKREADAYTYRISYVRADGTEIPLPEPPRDRRQKETPK